MDREKIIAKLIKEYDNNHLAHAFLIETNNIDNCLLELKQFIKYINCREKYSNNCDKCNLCKLIDLDNLPSLIVVRPDGMSIKKNQLLELQDKFSKKAVYSKYNIYIITNAELMNDSAANSILKFLEEPTDNIIGFLVTTDKEKVLDTIISRCQNFKFLYNEHDDDSLINNLANEYLSELFSNDNFLINKNIILSTLKERYDINRLFLKILNKYLRDEWQNYFPGNNFVDKNSQNYKKQLDIIIKTLTMINSNVNIELLLDYFVIEMRRSIKK